MAGDLLEASRSGHWAPARRVDDGFGKVAIRRRRRAVLWGSLFSSVLITRTFLILFLCHVSLSMPLIVRWAVVGCAVRERCSPGLSTQASCKRGGMLLVRVTCHDVSSVRTAAFSCRTYGFFSFINAEHRYISRFLSR
jgi:hypothetical protein